MLHKNIITKSILILFLSALFYSGNPVKKVFAESPSTIYIPLIGITSVPKPSVLPKGPGNVTYSYAVKNFLQEVPLAEIQVVDDKCSSIKFVEGDDNRNSLLDFNETWRYSCTAKISETTRNKATVTGIANNIKATHSANATVVVGSTNPYPLVSIVNITKVAYPLSLSAKEDQITYTYKVNNPGELPLSDVIVADDKCAEMSSQLGDTNGNNLLDVNEVWIYNCTASVKKTTTNTVTVTAYANGLMAEDNATIAVNVDSPVFPNTGTDNNLKNYIWIMLSGILFVLIVIFFFSRNKYIKRKGKK